MSDDRVFGLESVRADGWFERVVSNVPALGRLCEGLGEALVALALVAGFRIVSAGIDRVSGEVTNLQWVREGDGGTEISDSGPPEALRAEVLAALLGEADVTSELPEDPDVAVLRQAIGPRYVLLAPLFGLTLLRISVERGDEMKLTVGHDGVEEIVGLRQLRRFLRSRVIDVLQAQRNRSVSIDLERVEVARQAFAGGRYDEVVAHLAGWVSPLMMYLRTPEAAALESRTRADLARALGMLGESFDKLGRSEEGEETLRLAVQYAQDGGAAAELYRTLARVLIGRERRPESIGLIRRALTLEPAMREMLPDLGMGYLETGRMVAALGCLREARSLGMEGARLEALEAGLHSLLGARYEAFVQHVSAAPAE